jgi:hypothetical protein
MGQYIIVHDHHVIISDDGGRSLPFTNKYTGGVDGSRLSQLQDKQEYTPRMIMIIIIITRIIEIMILVIVIIITKDSLRVAA